MPGISNSLVGVLNFITFLLSIPILVVGIWLSTQATTECAKYLDKPVIIIGVLLMFISLAGVCGAWCRISWLLWLYLLVMFVLIVVLFAFTIFAFVVTNKGAGEALSHRGYKEYRLGDYSDWLQNRVSSKDNWSTIKSCLIDAKICNRFSHKYSMDNVEEFYKESLSSIQSGCCKPSNDCDFKYVSPIVWDKNNATTSPNSDCKLWGNEPDVLCFNCLACKAGLLDNIKTNWKKVALVNIVFFVFLIIVYSVGCCAFRNNREYNAYHRQRK
ncbi:Tetraspanin-7, partial [Cucurbita argyrosperma subsp. argyrosperma]